MELKFPHTVSEVLKQPCAQSKIVVKGQTCLSIQIRRQLYLLIGEKRFKKPILFSKRIQLSSEVKYFGITLDKGLT
jgi:hypothetical protein